MQEINRKKKMQMKVVLKIVGTRGSQKFRLVSFASEANREAKRLNQKNADGLGLSMRDYRERSEWNEGWHVAGDASDDGKATGL
jgi:hypothetical protein